MRAIVVALLFSGLCFARAPLLVHAHSLEFGVLVVDQDAGGATLTLRAGGREGRPPPLNLGVSGACALDAPPTREVVGGVLIVRARSRCFVGARVEVVGLERAGLRIAARLRRVDGTDSVHFLDPAHPALRIAPSPDAAPLAAGHVFRRYASFGAEHLALGFDHLLFLLALLLVVLDRRVSRASPFRALLLTVTGFTAGHALTLSLALLGGLSLPSAPVELCIALSIVLLAAELIRERSSTVFERPWLAAAGFGLLHGLGFAGALRELGLPASDAPLALLSFHVGLEAAQLLFVLAAYAGYRLVRRLAWSPRALAYAIGGVATFWVGLRVETLL